jgi:hypothetical protein
LAVAGLAVEEADLAASLFAAGEAAATDDDEVFIDESDLVDPLS